jgi:hypothetical protein
MRGMWKNAGMRKNAGNVGKYLFPELVIS